MSASWDEFARICADVLRARGGLELLANADCPALGVLEEARYTNSELTLSPGDGMFLYTDGVTEAQAPDESFYGFCLTAGRH